MKHKIILPIAMLIISLTSCTTSRSVVNNCNAQPQKLNIENINGMYAGKGLWNEFHVNKTTKIDTTKYSENVQTKIYFDGKKYITATVYDNGVKKNEVTVKAKVYKDYVSIKKHHKLLPFLPFYFYSDVHKFVLYNNAENDLGLCGYGSTTMVILIMSGGKGGDYSATYKRIMAEK
ncbi:hypothetical protein J2X31_003560 [Flavobacterium arsenatis]|uniref:Lipoprotein n=1 Tax=Flavobacterium arsenatis TaxID=1484332 RepID=A0ABU1TUP4_9FLAO|nr:hypothetical protein [Flavobacterium arsenatis]MDR6969527.1 hypothetical protein [Flavobacterium arsenatis]